MPADTPDGAPRFSIRRRLGVLTGLVLALLVVASLASVAGVRQWERSVGDRRSAREAANLVSQVRAGFSAQESAVRGFQLTGDDDDLAPFDTGRRQVAQALLLLDGAGIGGLDDTLARFEASAGEWHRGAAEPAIESRRAGDAVDETDVDAGRALYDRAVLAIDEMEALALREVQRLDDRVEAVQRRAVAGLVVAFVVALGGAALMMVLFRVWVTRPLVSIGEAARVIGEGGDAVAPSIGSEELASVWDAIDFLQTSLTEERDRAVRAYSALAQSAVLALQVRSELTAHERLDLAAEWSLATSVRPAEGVVAGDCYDVGFVNPSELYVVAVDVTGHGPLAALNALKAKAMLRSALKSGADPGEALGSLAVHGADGNLDFLSAMVATVRVGDGHGCYANAGHPPALLLVPAEAPLELAATGPIVGPFEAEWRTERFTMPPGATLVVYTDGLTEARGADGERLGEERLHEAVRSDLPLAAADVVTRLEALFDGFRDGPQADDMTLVALDHGAAHAASDELEGSQATVS